MSAQIIHPELKPEIFQARLRPHLLHDAVVMQQANRRAGTAATKSKGFVRGGGKKPWKQKGTGRARSGSIRSPIWVGGGTIFGPTPRDYSYRMPKTARREALLSALSLKHQEGKIVVVDKLEMEQPKTKVMRQLLDGMNVKSALIVVPEANRPVELSARNLPAAKVIRVEGLNVYDLLRFDHLILTEEALKRIERRLAA